MWWQAAFKWMHFALHCIIKVGQVEVGLVAAGQVEVGQVEFGQVDEV